MDVRLILLIVCLFAITLFILRQWLNNLEKKSGLSDELVEWLKSSTTNMNARLDNAAKLFSQVQKDVGEFSEIGRSMKELQDFLQSPKLRGNIGEQILKDLLSQHFPHEMFQIQYQFKSGEKVDAVIKTSSGMVCIDSKFPMENFRKGSKETKEELKQMYKKEFIKDVKKHINDISKKYIVVSEGTVDYALMYIPAESIFYEIIRDADLYDYSASNRVIPVSPLSFYAYMKAILMSYEGQKIQKQAKEILELLKSMKKDYERVDDSVSILTKHITNAYNQLSMVSKNIMSLGQKIEGTRHLPDKAD
ncbi:MAG: DNA recombination protein RmuC [Patescibacteria group bacterium]